jgi:cytochrome c
MKMTPYLAPAWCLLVCATAPAWALDGAQLYKERTCVACHGKDAETPIMPNYPKLAGQNADYAYNQMKDIQSGARTNGQTAAMKGVMHLVTDEELRAIADWLATLQ